MGRALLHMWAFLGSSKSLLLLPVHDCGLPMSLDAACHTCLLVHCVVQVSRAGQISGSCAGGESGSPRLSEPAVRDCSDMI